jgi:hypothetical protein
MGRHLFSANLKSPARSWIIDGKIPIGARGFTESTLAFRAVSTLNYRTVTEFSPLSIQPLRLTAADAEDAEGAQRNAMHKPLRFLCELCACGGELPKFYAQV